MALCLLEHIHSSIYRDKKQPTVRGLSEALGLKSSRFGVQDAPLLD